VHLLIRL